MRYNIKARLAMLGKRSTDVIAELRNYGIVATPSQFSNAINGRSYGPKDEQIAKVADEIVSKWERGER